MPIINPERNKLGMESKIFLLNEIVLNRRNNLINKPIRTAYMSKVNVRFKNPP